MKEMVANRSDLR